MKKIKGKISASIKFVIIESSEITNNGTADAVLWSDLMKNSSSEDKLIIRQAEMAVNKCCTVAFTSGTSQWPQKGVMLSHDNIVWSAYGLLNDLGVEVNSEHVLSVHPTGSIITQMFELWLPLIAQVCRMQKVKSLKFHSASKTTSYADFEKKFEFRNDFFCKNMIYRVLQ